MLRHTAHPTESRYEILGLFTASMIGASLVMVAIGTLLPYVSMAFPHERGHISLLVTALLFGAALTNAVSGAATDRFGDKAVLVACGTIMGISLMLGAAVPTFTWIALWFVVYGMGFAAINPVGSHAILFFFKPEERGLAMGVRQMGMPLGGVAGAIVISTAAEYFGYRGALLIAGALVLIVTLGSAMLYWEPPQLHGKPVRAGQVALVGFFPWTLVNEAHVSAGLAAIVFVIAQFAAAAGRLAWGWASDRRHRCRYARGVSSDHGQRRHSHGMAHSCAVFFNRAYPGGGGNGTRKTITGNPGAAFGVPTRLVRNAVT